MELSPTGCKRNALLDVGAREHDTPGVLVTDALDTPKPAGDVLNVKLRALLVATGQTVRTEASSGGDTVRTVAAGSTTLVCWVAMSVQVPVGPPEVTTTAVTLTLKPPAGQAAVAALLQDGDVGAGGHCSGKGSSSQRQQGVEWAERLE